MRVGDRLNLQGLTVITRGTNGDSTRTTAIAAGRLDDHLIARLQALAKALQRRAGHVSPTERPESSLFPGDHLRKSAVDVHADHASHPPLLLSTKREREATRHLRSINSPGSTQTLAAQPECPVWGPLACILTSA